MKYETQGLGAPTGWALGRFGEEQVARNRFVCSSCGAKTPIQPFCQECGQPTPVCTPDERILWEMGQWESSRAKQGKPVRAVSLPLKPTQEPLVYSPPPRDTEPPSAPEQPPAPPARRPGPPRPQIQQHPAARMAPPAPQAAPPSAPPAAPPRPQAPRPAQQPQQQRPAASTPQPPRAVPTEGGKRPSGPQIAAAAAASKTAHALELKVTEAPERRTIDKSATLQRIIRNIPRHTTPRPTSAPAGDTIVPETEEQHAARRQALEIGRAHV